MCYSARKEKNDPEDGSEVGGIVTDTMGPEHTGPGNRTVLLVDSREVEAIAFQPSERDLNNQAKYWILLLTELIEAFKILIKVIKGKKFR